MSTGVSFTLEQDASTVKKAEGPCPRLKSGGPLAPPTPVPPPMTVSDSKCLHFQYENDNNKIWYLHKCWQPVAHKYQFKGIKCPAKDMWYLLCLLQLLTWLHVSYYRNFWYSERWKFLILSLVSLIFRIEKPLSKWRLQYIKNG